VIRPLLGLLALVVSGAGPYESGPSPVASSVLTSAADTVHVAPPTGAAATDRANILAALEVLEPGSTLLFAPGAYWIGGAFIRVPVPDVILQGHPDGTTLRGCEPADLVEHERMAECNAWS
jgi:hypothetical protein